MHILAWIYCSSVVFYKALVWDGSLQYVQCAPYAKILQIFLLFRMIWYCRVQSPAVSKRQDVRWCNLNDRFRYPLTMFENRVLIRLSRLLHAHIAYETDTAKIIAACCRIHIVCMIIYGWIQLPAVFKRQDVRWCRFRWSLPLSIDYVWKSSMDRATSTPLCSYCIWNRYC